MMGELTNHLWQSTVFAVAAGLLTLAFRRNRAGVRYGIWFAASCKFLLPFALLIGAGSQLGWRPAARRVAAPVAMPAVSFTMSQIAQPFSGTATPALEGRANRDWWAMAIPAVWVAGVAFLAVLRFRDWLRVRAAVRASMPLDLGADVEVRSSHGLLEHPAWWDCGVPVLLVPAKASRRPANAAEQSGGGGRSRTLPRPASRQPVRVGAHDRRGDLLVPSGSVVDRRAPGGGARARVRRGGAPYGRRAVGLRRGDGQRLQALCGIAAGVRFQKGHGIEI